MKWIFIVLTFCCSTLLAQNKTELQRIANLESSWYEVLDVKSDASKAEIKMAYRRLISRYHPDKQRNPASSKAANEVMKRLNDAYEVLNDALKRKSYDITIKATSTVKAAGKTASSPNDAWKKYSFTDFAEPKPEKPTAKPTEKPKTTAEPTANSKPEPKAEAKAVAKTEPTEVQARNNSPASMKAKQAMKMYGENSKCGLGYFQPLIDIKQ